MTLGDLFTPVPLRWGLRGDPRLWEAMRQRFEAHPYPANEWVLTNAVRAAFEELTGVRFGNNIGHVQMPAYRTGSGMSDGLVDGDWWYDVGLTLLLDRWNVIHAGGHRAG